MKNVRIIRTDEAAVAPVIATILMVAITVVLAAVLYVMVSGLIGGPNGAPKAMGVNISRSADATNWTLLISSAPSGLLLSDATLTVLAPGGAIVSAMNQKLFSTLNQANWGANGAIFQHDGDPHVEAGESLLLRHAGASPTYSPNSRVEISDRAQVLFSGLIIGPGGGSGSTGPYLDATLERSPSPPYTYTLTIVSASSGLTMTNTKVDTFKADGTHFYGPVSMGSLHFPPTCTLTDTSPTSTVNAGDKVVCGTTQFPMGGTVKILDANGVILWTGQLPP